MKNIYSILLLVALLIFGLDLRAQNRVIKGTVSDKEGPIPGASVIEKGAPNNGVSTTLDGKFEITLRGNSNVLIVRSVGLLTQEVSVGGRTDISVVLEPDAKGLEEVVVVAYGTQKKIAVTGSISTVSRNDIQQTPSASLQNTLAGKLPGFTSQQRGGRPGADGAEFFIRGVSTYNTGGGGAQPLILVDDVPFTYADFSNIDPNEIESLSILKDAATTAPYGVKGANGVVLVTTRRGTVGKARISARSEFGAQVPVYKPHFVDAATSAMLFNEGLRNQYIITNGNANGFVPMYSEQDIKLYADGSDPYLHPNVDWYKTLFKDRASISKTNLDISGGTTALKYFVSAGYESQGGLMRNFHSDDVNNDFFFDRFNFRSNVDIAATKSLSFKVDLSGNNTVTNNPRVNSRSNNPTAALYEVYNYEFLRPNIYPIYNPNGSWGFAPPGAQPSFNNIIGRLTNNGYSRTRQNLLSFNGAAIQKLDGITPGLNAKVQISVTNSNSSSRGLNRVAFPSYYFDGTNYIARLVNESRINPYNLEYSGGTPKRQSTIQASLNYQHTFGKHDVTALVLYNQNTELFNTASVDDNYKARNFRGFTGRLAYNFANKYLIEFDGAYNGTDKFASAKKFGFFPSIAGGYVISEEKFLKNVNFLSLLKLRGSWGKVGNDNLAGFANFYEENYGLGGTYSFGETHTQYTSIVPGTLGNDAVYWENERKANIALDFSFFKGRLSGTVEAFDNKRSDILQTRNSIPAYFGLPDAVLPAENIGIVSNRGFEFELSYTGKIGKDFSYTLKGNYSYAKNKILYMDEVPPIFPYLARTGRSIGEEQLFEFIGYYTPAEAADPTVAKYSGSSVGGVPNTTIPGFLKYRDRNNDGVITNDDQAYIGRPNMPTSVAGFTQSYTYKRFSLNILLQGAWGNDIRVGYVYSAPFKANVQDVHLGRWTPETAATATFPALTSDFAGSYMSNNNSTYWATDGRYLRIRSLEFSYRIPDKLVNKLGLASARAYANGYNLYTWSKVHDRTGLDSEVANQGLAGDYTGVYPQMAIMNLGLNLTFK